jgi:hypothetical protein
MHCTQYGSDRKIKRIVNTSARLGHSPHGGCFCCNEVDLNNCCNIINDNIFHDFKIQMTIVKSLQTLSYVTEVENTIDATCGVYCIFKALAVLCRCYLIRRWECVTTLSTD